MKKTRFRFTLMAFLAAGAVGGCAEQRRSGLRIDPPADDALRKMSAAIGGAKSFSFRSVATMEEPVATGQMAEFSREVRMVVRRPDKLLAEGRQDDDALFLWYGGKTLTVRDKSANTYAALEVPGRIDDMLDDVAKKHGLTVPLADLLYADPYRVLTADVHTGSYVGMHEVDGVKCHHLLFTQEAIDWQIWIEAETKPVPRKLVIDYKSVPGRPQFTAVLSDWELSAEVKDEQFRPAVPRDARKVEIGQLLAAGQGE